MSEPSIWQDIETALTQYKALRLNEVVDYEKYALYSIITHSTAIEGSTLTEEETRLLLDDGLTAKGKPLIHHLMNEDLRAAYTCALQAAKEKKPVTVQFLRELNALVMKSTGSVIHSAGGDFNSSKGDFRLCNVTAGRSGTTYLNYTKVPAQVAGFVEDLQKNIPQSADMETLYNFTFDAHFNLVTIHPWVDGNGRTSRLLMNYLQFFQDAVPVKVFSEDKADYIAALVESQKTNAPEPFRNFMATQFLKMLKQEIAENRDKENGNDKRKVTSMM
jgi:Fic family protein